MLYLSHSCHIVPYTDTTLWYDVETFYPVDTILSQGITFDQSTSQGPRELFQCEIICILR